jgi:hypothetical protein
LCFQLVGNEPAVLDNDSEPDTLIMKRERAGPVIQLLVKVGNPGRRGKDG